MMPMPGGGVDLSRHALADHGDSGHSSSAALLEQLCLSNHALSQKSAACVSEQQEELSVTLTKVVH